MRKTANLYARIEPEVKEQAEAILEQLGISTSSAINMFYKQIILNRGLPFDVVLPTNWPTDISKMTAEEVSKEIEKGVIDYKEGRVKPMERFLSDVSEEYKV